MASGGEKELERIERDLDAKASGGIPPAEPQAKGGWNAGMPNRSANQIHLDAVIVGAVLLTAIAFITMLGESFSPKQKPPITATALVALQGCWSATKSSELKPDHFLRPNRWVWLYR